MTSRERVLTTIRREEPDRVPYNLRLEQSLAQAVCKELDVADLPEHFGHDIRYVGLQLPRRRIHRLGVPYADRGSTGAERHRVS